MNFPSQFLGRWNGSQGHFGANGTSLCLLSIVVVWDRGKATEV